MEVYELSHIILNSDGSSQVPLLKCQSSAKCPVTNVTCHYVTASPHNGLTGCFSQQWQSHAWLSCVTSGSCDKTILECMCRKILQEEDLLLQVDRTKTIILNLKLFVSAKHQTGWIIASNCSTANWLIEETNRVEWQRERKKRGWM